MPERSCLGCGQKREKGELVRIVSSSGELKADFKNIMPGRGMYICPDFKCLDGAIKKRAFFRALGIKGEFDREELREMVEWDGRLRPQEKEKIDKGND